MHFYTNVSRYRNLILVREFKDGKNTPKKYEYKPTLYVPTNKDSSFRSITGQNLEPKKFKSIGYTRPFIDKYKDVEGFDIHGNQAYAYSWITDTFPNDIEWSMGNISIMCLDIECECENGFPEPTDALEEVNAITFKMFGSPIKYTFGTQPWNHGDTVSYTHLTLPTSDLV